ncbi:MAG TPA: NAD+ synthase [Polyangia bacterium]|nr:NAD+ synthase [Polyangia bacterium]
MRIALAQLNPIVGDFDGNLRLVLDALERARKRGAGLCVFSELVLSGYPPHDLLERPLFIERNLQALGRVADACHGIAAVVGHARPNPHPVGKGLLNAAALLEDGKVRSIHAKTLLPTYDVFDERRYFDPAREVTVVELDGMRLGISVCEDIWNVVGTDAPHLYDRDPIAELVAGGAEILISVSASPFTLHKRGFRPRMLRAAAVRHGRPVVFVNQVGGDDELVFDGHSLAFAADGRLIARAREFEEDLVVVDLESASGEVREPAETDEDAVLAALVIGTRDYARKCGFSSAVLGLSGGIDSAVAAVVAARALGPENVLGVALPTRYSSAGSLTDARALTANLGLGFREIPVDGLFQAFLETLGPVFEGREPDVTEENLQARVRGVVLMALSNKLGHLLLTTGNKSELATGYCTLYGDMAGGLAALGDVPKTLVYRLARRINDLAGVEVVPRNTIDKPPSAELAPDQRDDDSLPPYPVLDGILEALVDRGLDVAAVALEGFDGQLVQRVARLVRGSEYKRRQAPPVLKVTSKAFGFGRRMPLAHRWRG